jgi:Chaperone of endosialidase
MNTKYLAVSIAVIFGFVVCLPKAEAVVPPPPGGYPNFTTAAGDHALQALTLGLGNTALGTFSLFSVNTGSFNTAVGAGALDLNTADSNTATGAAALLFNTTGAENTANGTAALEFNDLGFQNTATGAFALFSNTAGLANTASGADALFSNTGGQGNTAIGVEALSSNTTANFNTANGNSALSSNTTGGSNTAIGSTALANSTTGSGNIGLGNNAGANVITATDVTCIGNVGKDVNDSCFISRIRGVQTQNANAIPVLIDSDGQLGTLSSSRRFKKEIKAMDKASEAILALEPVTFHYKGDNTSTPQFGLIAEEVAEVNPDLVVREADGKVYTVRYEAVNAMLLNEFLKEHREVQDLKKQVVALTAGLQKVSAQLEASKPAPQVVNNNQ